MRTTHALVQTALELMADPDGKHWGYDLGKRAGVRSGVLYPMLTRMLAEGWLTDGWEDPSKLREKRPPRRYYKVTEKGKICMAALLRNARADLRFTDLRARWA